jgi:translocation and assembly module TamB
MRFEISLVEANLSLLTLLGPQVEEAVGRLEGHVLLGGTPRHPEMTGRLTVRDGRIKLRTLGTWLEQLQADVSFSEDRITINTLTARLGEGTAQAGGTIAIAAFRPTRVEQFTLRTRDARVEIAPVFAGKVDADVTLSGPLGDPARPPELVGQMVLKEGDLVLTGAPAEFFGPGARGPDLRLRQVRLVGGPALAVHLGRLRIDLKEGSVVVAGGTLRQPSLDGELTAERGTLTVFGQPFLLQEGHARFLPQLGLTPIISALAETQIGAIRVFVEVRHATPDELADRLILRSEPSMSREEIVALLARQSGLAHLATGDVQAALQVELSRALFGQVGQTIARALGLSEFTIQYDVAQPLRLRIGKLLIRDLFVTLTTVFQERTRFIWALEWRFARNLMLTFTLDNFGRFDGLLLYTVRF